jgi:benzoyl-CoA reductase/2-hydroxyglutaryl-CoA dehydratase subunit BcrC/BadD/HgdB
VFRLTYPAARFDEDSILFLAEELRILSKSMEHSLGKRFSEDKLRTGVALVNQFREAAQTLYATRIIDPNSVSYLEVTRMLREFLTTPEADTLDPLSRSASAVSEKLEQQGQLGLVKSLQEEMLLGTLNSKLDAQSKTPRIMIVGGMTEPLAVASLFKRSEKIKGEVVVMDLLTYGFKTVFTPPVRLEGDPFVAMSRAILNAPSEPTQEGLPGRLEFIRLFLSELSINGVAVCEQSFCDPDQFEAPSILKLCSEVGVPSVRLPIDPELSDRARLEGRIQSFLETLEGGSVKP